jgi:hypothetical protein
MRAGVEGDGAGTGYRRHPARWHGRRLLALVALAAASGPVRPAWAAAAAPPRATYEVNRASGPIRVDGVLDEPAWRAAVPILAHIETYPGENLESAARTECRMLFDESYLYVSLHAFDPHPEQIRAHLTDRDNAFEDDFVGIIIDTFNDERRAYELFVNPLGVQMDLVLDDISRNEDASWDAIWDSAGRITADGYLVEMAIPFAQLRFPAGGGRQTWGLDVGRVWPRDQRYVIRSQPQDRNRDCSLCQASRLAGLEGARPGHNLELDPTLTAQRDETRADFPDGPLASDGTRTEAGITARWGVTPGVTVAAALNPDFSQVEADSAQLSVNTQFALFYQEKRPFFLEGADFLTTPIQAVYTRTVADPSWGVKASGKAGAYAFSAYVARDDVTNLLLPGKESSELTALDTANLAGVARLRRDVGANSTLGVLVTARQGDGYANAVAGVDGMIHFGTADSISFQALHSSTEYPVSIQDGYGQPAGTLGDTAATAVYRHDARDWFWKASLQSTGKEFRADSGFVPQVDLRKAAGTLQRNWWGGKDDALSQIQLGVEYAYSEDTAGRHIEDLPDVFVYLAGPLQSSLTVVLMHGTHTYNGVSFPEAVQHLEASVRPNGAIQLALEANFGDQIDFANTRGGTRVSLEPSLVWRAGTHLQLSGSYAYEHLDVEGGRLYTARLTQTRIVWQFSLRTFVRLITQYVDVTHDPALYLDPVNARDRQLFNQALLSYKVNPQTVFFLGYSDSRDAFSDELRSVAMTPASRTLFVKLGYAWLP